MSIENDLTIVRVKKPSFYLAQMAQSIGWAAWRNQLDLIKRPDDQLKNTFDPTSSASQQKLLERMEAKANDGKFIGLVAFKDGESVGYAWLHQDVSGSPFSKMVKRITGKNTYTCTAQINVLPQYQGEGVGSVMQVEGLSEFDPNWNPTAYVFEENKLALNWFQKRRYEMKPRVPVPKYNYFGQDADPAMQLRLEGDSRDYTIISTRTNYPQWPSYEVVDLDKI